MPQSVQPVLQVSRSQPRHQCRRRYITIAPEIAASPELFCASEEVLQLRKTNSRIKNRSSFISSSTPSRAGALKVVLREEHSRRLRISPVSWLGGSTGSRPSRIGAHIKREQLAAVAGHLSPPYSRAAATACLVKEKIPITNRLPEREIRGDCGGAMPAMGEMFCRGSNTAALSCTDTKCLSRNSVAKSTRETWSRQFLSRNLHRLSRSATTFTRGLPDGPSSTPAASEKPAPAIPADTQLPAAPLANTCPLNQQHLVRIFRRQIQFVGYDHHGVAIFVRQMPQSVSANHLRCNIQMQRRLIQQ